MKYQYGCNVITERKKEIGSSSALALAVALALVFSGPAAMGAIDPIPGVDIIVKKHPGDIAVITPIDASGKFSLRLEPGQYTISTACQQPSACPSHTITAQYSGDANFAPKTSAGVSDNPGGLAPGTYNGMIEFTVGKGGVVFSGQIQSAAGPASTIGVPSLHNGVATFTVTVAPPPDKPQPTVSVYGQPVVFTTAFKIAENESPRPSDAAARATGVATDLRDASPGIMVRESPTKASGDGKLPSTGFEKTFLGGEASTKATIDSGDSTPSQLNSPTTTSGKDGAIPSMHSYIGTVTLVKKYDAPRSGGTGELPGSVKVSTTTDEHGAFKFTKLQPGVYTITFGGTLAGSDQPTQSVTVGADGIVSGEVNYSDNHGEGRATRVFRITNVRVNATPGGDIDNASIRYDQMQGRSIDAKPGAPTANWERWENGAAVPPNATPPKVVTGNGADKFDQLRKSATPGTPGNFGGVGSGAGIGAMGSGAMGPGAMGPGAGGPMRP